MSKQLRHKTIAETAYYLAEKEAFVGDPIEYWLQAEAKLNAKVAKKPKKPKKYGLLNLSKKPNQSTPASAQFA